MYLLFDIGATNMRLSSSVDAVRLGEPKIVRTPASCEEMIAVFGRLARELSDGQPYQAASGGVAASLDHEKQNIVFAANLPDWSGKPLKAELEKTAGAPVYLENDAALGGLGEAHRMHDAKKRIVGYISVGTGVGGARIVNGRLDANAVGFEPGHQIIDCHAAACPACGAPGDLESLIGGAALAKKHGTSAHEITDPAVWREAERHLAYGLYNTMLHWSPDVMVVGGSIVHNGAIALDAVRHHLSGLASVLSDIPSIEPGQLGDGAGLSGALVLLRRNMNFPD